MCRMTQSLPRSAAALNNMLTHALQFLWGYSYLADRMLSEFSPQGGFLSHNIPQQGGHAVWSEGGRLACLTHGVVLPSH